MLIYSNSYNYIPPVYDSNEGNSTPQEYYENEDNQGSYQFIGIEETHNNRDDGKKYNFPPFF